MTFLSPYFLWALPLVLSPLVLHLLARRPPKIIPFSHVPWLKEVHRNLMPRRRLEEIILLILRTLLLLVLIGFFSRPLLEPFVKSPGNASPSSVIVLLDVSASMGAVVNGRVLLDGAKDNLRQLVRKIPKSMKIGWVVYSNRVEWELPPSMERSKALATIDNLSVEPRPTDITPALLTAKRFMEDERGETRLLVVSDQARHGWEALLKSTAAIGDFPEKTSLHLWEMAPRIPNAGIADLSLQWGDTGLLKGQAKVFGSLSEGKKGPWKLWMGGRVVSQGELKGGDLDGGFVGFETQVSNDGPFSGELRLPGDDLTFDDVFYFSGRTPRGYRLLVVQGEAGLAPSESETYYLRSALESPKDSRVKSVQVVSPRDLTESLLKTIDVVVLANTDPMEEKKQFLLDWVERGGGLLMSAGSHWKEAETPLGIFKLKGKRSKTLNVAAMDERNPFTARVGGKEAFEWSQITVTDYVDLEMDEGIDPLMRLSNGSPLLATKKMGLGRVACLTSTLDRAWTNFPVKPAYSPVLRELLADMAGPDQGNIMLSGLVDEPFRIRLPNGVQRITVTTPDGSSGSGKILSNGNFEWPNPQMSGIYQVRTNIPSQDFSFAINEANREEEGRLARVTESDLKRLLPNLPVFFVGSGPKSQERILSTLTGKDLTTLCLMLALLFFMSECALVYFLPRKREKSS